MRQVRNIICKECVELRERQWTIVKYNIGPYCDITWISQNTEDLIKRITEGMYQDLSNIID